MKLSKEIKVNIIKSTKRTRAANLNTAVVLQVCCYIDGLGKLLFGGKSESRFKQFIKCYMPNSFSQLKKRSVNLRKGENYCLDILWREVRCGLVHEINPKFNSVILGRGKTIVHQNIDDKRFLSKGLVLSSPRFVDDFLSSLELLNS